MMEKKEEGDDGKERERREEKDRVQNERRRKSLRASFGLWVFVC